MIQWMPVLITPSGAGKIFLYPSCYYIRHVLYMKCENRFLGDGIRHVLIIGVLITGIHCTSSNDITNNTIRYPKMNSYSHHLPCISA